MAFSILCYLGLGNIPKERGNYDSIVSSLTDQLTDGIVGQWNWCLAGKMMCFSVDTWFSKRNPYKDVFHSNVNLMLEFS